MKLLVISSNFPPRNNAGVFRTLRFVKYLPQNGWDIDVLTVDPKYCLPGENVDPQLEKQIPESVRVHGTRMIHPFQRISTLKNAFRLRKKTRSPSIISYGNASNGNRNAITKTGLWQRFKDSLTVPLMTPDRSIGWLPFAVRKGMQIIRQRNILVLYSSAPPWTSHLVGYRLKKKSNLPWVADFRDPWVGASFRAWRRDNTRVGRSHQKWERRVIEFADHIIVNTDQSREEILSRYGEMFEKKISVLPNGFDPEDYDFKSSSETTHRHPKLAIAHAGAFYGKRNIHGLVQALGNLKKRGQIDRERLEIRLIGALGKNRSIEQQLVSENSVDDIVKVLPRLSHMECLLQLRDADILLLVQTGAPLSIPGKAFEYIALGKPIFCLTTEGATSDLICKYDLGICIEPNDNASIEKAVLALPDLLSDRKRLNERFLEAQTRFNGIRQTEELSEILKTASVKTQYDTDLNNSTVPQTIS